MLNEQKEFNKKKKIIAKEEFEYLLSKGSKGKLVLVAEELKREQDEILEKTRKKFSVINPT